MVALSNAEVSKEVLPGLQMDDPAVALEEVFSAYEIRRDDPRSSRDEAESASDAFSDLLNALRIATYVFGRGDAKKWIPHGRDGEPSPYAELIEQLLPPGAGGPVHHSFITFNYDVNLDRCLLNLRGSMADFDIDYGFQLTNWRCTDAPTFAQPRVDRAILLLRTHGALNWIRCRACRSVFTTLSKQQEIPEDLKCYACRKVRVEYVLVHPSQNRTYDDAILQLVWGRAYEELTKADRWVFVGYSLPPADVHFRELLRDSLRARAANHVSTEIVLVGRGPETNPAFVSLVARYEAVFKGNLTVWRATANGFGDFVSSLD